MKGPNQRQVSPSGGFTLLELLVTVCLVGVCLSLVIPVARREIDRLAVEGAREAVVGLFHQVRTAALAHGEAQVRLMVGPPHVQVLAGGETIAHVDLGREYGVGISLSRDRDEVELGYDAMGLGRVASQTILIFRGDAKAALVVSAYGRVRKR